MSRKLTAKQELFVKEYLIDLNATQAAIRAGYAPKRAAEQGYQLLHKTTVSEAVACAMAERSKRLDVNSDRIIQELSKLAFVNLADLVDPNTGMIRENAKPEDLACLQSVKIKEAKGRKGFVEREVKIGSKYDSLKLLGQHLGIWDNKNEQEAKTNVPVVIAGEDMLED